VKGRYGGHIAEGRMATSIIGAGRVFHTSVIDGAGGAKWLYEGITPKSESTAVTLTFEGDDPALSAQLPASLKPIIEPLAKGSSWIRLEYDPGPGHVRLTKPMRTRHDIPSAEEFRHQLDAVVAAAQSNRAVQHPEP
jgi:hypothetical protein